MANKETLTQLVKSARSGNSQAINKLFESCYNDIYYFALKTVKNEDTAYDITQEACIEIFNGLPSLENESAFTTWSRQIAYRRCCRYFEKNRDVLVDEGDEENNIFDSVEDSDMDFIPDAALDRDDFRKTIMDMINALSEEQRTAVMLYYFDELSVGEIAQIQDVSEGTVKSRLNYARKSIKTAVEDYEEKNNIKLHSFGLLPLLLWLRGGDMAGLSIPTAGAGLQGALSGLSSIGTAAVTTAGTGSTVASTAVATASKGIATKIIAGIVALTVAIGGSYITYNELKNERDTDTRESKKHSRDDITITESELETESNTAPLAPIEDPEDYISEKLEMYGDTFRLRDRIVKYMVDGSYLVTKAKEIYSVLDLSAPIGIASSLDHIYSFYNDIAYVNEDGYLIVKGLGVELLLPNPDHQVVDIYATGLISSYLDVITRDSSGNFYYTTFVKEDMSTPVNCVPIAVYDTTIDAMAGKIIEIEICYDEIYDDDYVYIVTDDTMYLTNIRELSEDGSQFVFYGEPVTDRVEKIIPSKRSEDSFSPFYIKDGNDTCFYRINYSISAGEDMFGLPEGYVAAQIERIVPAYHTWIITFSDGSVYTFSSEYTRMDYLSDLYADESIEDFYLYNQNIWNDGYDIVLWMKDNGLYKYIW